MQCLLNGAVSVNGGRFSGNATAIESTFCTTLRVSGATFTDNTGPDGGAIYGTGSVNVTDSTFTRNSAELGGAVYLQFGKQDITRCQFSGNTAIDAGGSLYDDGNVTMTSSTFYSNHARGGTGRAGTESRRVPWRPEPWRPGPARSVPGHHGGHLPPLLLRELTGG